MKRNHLTWVLTKRFKIHVNKEYCKGCRLCIDTCPVEALTLSKDYTSRGYHYPLLTGECVGCTVCETFCPDFAISVEEEK